MFSKGIVQGQKCILWAYRYSTVQYLHYKLGFNESAYIWVILYLKFCALTIVALWIGLESDNKNSETAENQVRMIIGIWLVTRNSTDTPL